MIILLILVARVCVISGVFVMYGAALALMWGWFVVPTFGLPPLATAPATGLWLLARLLVVKVDRKTAFEKQDDMERELKKGLYTVLLPLAALLAGFVVKQWM